ncbi:TPA: bifunctional adenosylcobinamide kinase/adenosylcobinamide-phosphate guanylyltransferase [Candidatus Poribacteria bacterium]|nr:bifunctional adenosylcobinamide kinase/adenosylcobinamide-phosphate guanylyltransferase [Candidatus Poribacteria bacterium]
MKELINLGLILITGGARSGKSRYAVELAKQKSGKVAFIATAIAGDEEMTRRIRMHQSARPSDWTTIEESINVAQAIADAAVEHKTIIVDCLTLFITNLVFKPPYREEIDDQKEQNIYAAIEQIVDTTKNVEATVIIISNELGMGLVPEDALARRFRDIAGRANQLMAEAADEAYVCISGIPMRIKGENETGK